MANISVSKTEAPGSSPGRPAIQIDLRGWCNWQHG